MTRNMTALARGLCLCLCLVAAAPHAARGQACPTRASWPTLDWPDRTAAVATARAAEIAELEEYTFTLTGKDKDRLGIRTNAVVIVQAGDVVYERYARGFDASKRHLGWSVTKSVMNALVGRAVHLDLLALDDSICDHLTSGRPEHCDIRVVDFLEFGSGLAWKELYEGQSNQESSPIAMFYGQGHRDMATFVLGHERRAPPGATFQYSSGDSVVLAALARAALEPTHGELFPWDLLFDLLGMGSAVVERDQAGTLVGGSYFYATPRDYARFGYLFLNDGCWDGERLLPEGWVAASTAVSEPYRLDPIEEDEWVQGRQWWLNLEVPEQGVLPPWPDAPEDTFSAVGHWGQYIAVIPSLDLVIARTGDDRDDTFDFNEFLLRAIAVGRAP